MAKPTVRTDFVHLASEPAATIIALEFGTGLAPGVGALHRLGFEYRHFFYQLGEDEKQIVAAHFPKSLPVFQSADVDELKKYDRG